MFKTKEGIASIIVCALVLVIAVPFVTIASTTDGGWHRLRPQTQDPVWAKSVYWGDSTDITHVMQLDPHRGVPAAIIAYQWRDNENADRGKDASANGEAVYFDLGEYEGASLSDGQITTYRVDLDGNDTLIEDVWSIIYVSYLETTGFKLRQ